MESSHQFFKFCRKSNVKSSREDISGDEGNREKSSGLRWDHTLVRQTIFAYHMKADELSFQSYQTALDTNIVTHGSKPSASPTPNKQYSRSSSVSIDKAVLFETSEESQTARKDTVHVSNRKRPFIYTPDDGIKAKMEKYVDDVYKLSDDLGSKENCWLHPFPPSASKNGRPRGTIQCNFVWNDTSGKNSLYVNVGILALIIEYHLTKEQMEGYVKDSWQLSHLRSIGGLGTAGCGGWGDNTR